MNSTRTNAELNSAALNAEPYSGEGLIIARITAVVLLLAGVIAGGAVLSVLPQRSGSFVESTNAAVVLEAMFVALTGLILVFLAVWPQKRLRALQSLPGRTLVVLVAGIGLLFMYAIVDVTEALVVVEPGSALHALEEATKLLGTAALFGAIAFWVRDLSRTRDRLLLGEDLLRRSAAELEHLFELYPDPTLLIDPETARPVQFNPSAHRQLGYTAEEFAGLRIEDFEASMTPEEIEQHIRTASERGRDDFETRHRCKDGTITDVQVSVIPLSMEEPRLLAVFRDISEHKKAVRDLEESEKRFADVAMAAGEYIWEINTEGIYTSVTAPVEPLLGYPVEDVIGHSPYEFMPPDEAKRVQELLRGYAAEKSSWQGLEHTSLRPDGTLVYQRVSGLPIISATGELLGFRGTGLDITAERDAEAAQRALSERLALATESAGLGIWDYDLTTHRLEWDERMFRLYGMDPAEFGHSFEDWTRHQLPESREHASARFQAAIESDNTFDTELSVRRPNDGAIRILQGQAQIIRDEAGQAVRVVGINRDITEQEENRRRLAAEEEKFRTLFELAPVGIAMNDFATGEFLRFNDAISEPAGYTREEFAALSYWDLTPAEYTADEQAQLESMQRTGRYGPFQKEYIRKDGSRYPVLLHGFRFTTPEGREVIWSIIQDISEQQAVERALRTSKERFGGIFEQTSSGVAVYRPVDGGADFEFVDYNAAAARMDRKAQDSVIGRRLSECFPGIRDMGLLEVLQRVARTGEPEQLPLSEYEDEEITGWRENRVFRLSSGEIVAVYDDLTGIKKAQQESERARREAEQASRAKSEFLANMSHEIRTPMNAVIGLSRLLMQTTLNDQQQDHANKIYRSSQMLLGIINDILDFSKIESGKLELEERGFSLNEIVDQMATLFGETAHARQLELLFDIQPGVPQALVGDSLRLSQVLTNLLSNAIKFTEPGGVVELGIRSAGPASDQSIRLGFSVRDTGIGMSQAEARGLFRPFAQIDSSTTRRHGGTGLGLVISRRLVEKMGGELAVDSEPGMGSTFSFTITLPISEEDTGAVGCPMTEGGRVLIVDDQAAARKVICELLHHCGIVTEEAESGEAAIGRVVAAEQRGEPFDFIFMDWMMPNGMNGSETCEALERMRRNGELEQTGAPILMISAYQKDEISLPEGLSTDFLSKPVTAASVYDALMRAESGEGLGRERLSVSVPVPVLDDHAILLVEDNDTNREVAQLLLEKTGVRMRTAKNGAEALDAVRAESPDLILMDLQMPVMDGFQATRALRGEGYAGAIIALSAAVMDDDRRNAREAGMDAHISKPIESEKLYAVLVDHLGAATPAAAMATPAAVRSEGGALLPERLPGFDLARGRRRLGDDDAFYARQLRQFAGKLRSDYEPLLDRLRSGQVEEARSIAHALKGAAGTLAAVDLQQLAGQIDHALARGLSVESSLVDDLERALDAAGQALATLDQPRETPVTGTAEAVETLKSQLEKNELVDDVTLQEALAYLRACGYDSGTLEERVEQMDFDSALLTLNAIMDTQDRAET